MASYQQRRLTGKGLLWPAIIDDNGEARPLRAQRHGAGGGPIVQIAAYQLASEVLGQGGAAAVADRQKATTSYEDASQVAAPSLDAGDFPL
jgi:hypothetical protein